MATVDPDRIYSAFLFIYALVFSLLPFDLDSTQTVLQGTLSHTPIFMSFMSGPSASLEVNSDNLLGVAVPHCECMKDFF